MEKLNSDVVSVICSRLPIESILQCRKVCRTWRSLFKKPKTGILFSDRDRFKSFNDVELHYREPSCDLVNLNCTANSYSTATNIFGYRLHSITLFGSCNGLVCYKTFEDWTGEVIYVSNPVTRECIRVPKADTDHGCIGFGYCHSTNEYKVVKIVCSTNYGRCVRVYTLGDGSTGWRNKQELPYKFLGSGVFANGALHWFRQNKKSRDFCNIVAFDLADETFQSLPLPVCHLPSGSYMNVTLGGGLYVCIPHCVKPGECTMDIWVFKKKRSSTRLKERPNANSFAWRKVFSSSKWDEGSKCQLLSVTKTEILLWQNGNLSCYDAATFEKLRHAQDPWTISAQVIPRMNSLVPHMNSLVSFKDLGEQLVYSSDVHLKN